MSATPTKDEDVEQGGQSPDGQEDNPMEESEAQAQALGYDLEVKEQDRWLPIANVARIMKTALPDNAKIAKEAKECMQECVSEFISFITSEASEKCQQEKRKTVNGEDILFAMTSLGFENYAEALKIYLSKYRETQSARGENQNRPGSGGGFGPGGAVGGSSSTTDAPSGSEFQATTHAPNNILSPSGVGNHEGSTYASGYPPTIPGTHNGNGAESY